jgi:hypothetical protein
VGPGTEGEGARIRVKITAGESKLLFPVCETSKVGDSGGMHRHRIEVFYSPNHAAHSEAVSAIPARSTALAMAKRQPGKHLKACMYASHIVLRGTIDICSCSERIHEGMTILLVIREHLIVGSMPSRARIRANYLGFESLISSPRVVLGPC